LRYLLAWNAELRGKVLAAIMRALQKHYVKQAEAQGAVNPQFGAVSVLQRWNGSLRVFPHWHILVADGAWARTEHGDADDMPFVTAPPLREEQLEALLVDVAARVTRQEDRHFAKRARRQATTMIRYSRPNRLSPRSCGSRCLARTSLRR
jgi:hypothetical protein